MRTLKEKNDLAGLLLSSFSFLFETSKNLGEFFASLFSRISTVVQKPRNLKFRQKRHL